MNNDLILIGRLFFLVTIVGYYLAYIYGRKTKEFRYSEYVAIIFFPSLFVLYLGVYISVNIFYLYLASSIVGFLLEYILGFVYHKTLNRRLWYYRRLNVGGYTSLLVIPIWGIAGVIFWFLSKMVGL